jgi:O-antigen/teichoic acid export membrane protein
LFQLNSKSIFQRGFHTSFAASLSRVVNMISGFIAAPILISYADSELFGYWLTVSSILGILVLADLGIGSALVNWLSSRNNQAESSIKNLCITSAYAVLASIGLTLLIVLLIWANTVDLSNYLSFSTDLQKMEIKSILIVVIIISCINIPLGLIAQIQLGFQQAYIAEYFRTIGYIFGIAFLFIGIYFSYPLHLILLGYSGFPVLANLANLIYYSVVNQSFITFRLSNFDRRISLQLIQGGFIFLLINIANIIGTSLDNYFIATSLGASEVAVFGITKQMFSVLYFVVFLASPFWPAFSAAIAEENHKWISKFLFKLSMITTIPTIFICAILYNWGGELVAIWINPDVAPSKDLLLAFTFFWIISGIVQPTIYLLQVENLKMILLTLTALFGFIVIIIKFMFISELGAVGIVWTNALAYLVLFVIPAIFIVFKRFY